MTTSCATVLPSARFCYLPVLYLSPAVLYRTRVRVHRDELLRYGNHALTRRMVDRVFTQEPRRFQCTTPNRMGYEDFVRKCNR